MKKNGRPTKYTEELGDKIARHILEGLTIKDACYGAGISDDTFRRWREKYPEFNKKVVEASNKQWESSEAIAKYHSGYRPYRRPKTYLSPDYDENVRKVSSVPQNPAKEPLMPPRPQFWMGLPVKYQAPDGELVPTPRYYNATTDRVEWVERDFRGRCVFHTCRSETYVRKLQEQAWRAELDSIITVI
ncbi:transposase [Candidatus Saccharibacteria bacterium]|nr:transposase [Candidatus Saccharibacteria bacterium]